MKTIGHWINGEHVTAPGASTSPVFNPATGAEQAQLQLATVEQVNEAVRHWIRPDLLRMVVVAEKAEELKAALATYTALAF